MQGGAPAAGEQGMPSSHDAWSRLKQASIAGACLAVCGCASHDYIRSYTYEYTEPHRLGGERRADQAMQDSCYFSGYQYFKAEGPPQIERVAGAAGEVIRATQAFYCVGTVGGP
jgi:hypothetical protein